VFKDELVFVMPNSHPLSSKDYIEASDLESEVYLTYSKTAQPGFEYERFIRPSGVVPHLVTVVEVTDAILELITAGFGVSILSKWAIQSAIKNGSVSVVRLGERPLDLDWSALVRNSAAMNSAARVVSARLAQWFQT
jgi:LysR family transcriptional regulator for metE and metH